MRSELYETDRENAALAVVAQKTDCIVRNSKAGLGVQALQDGHLTRRCLEVVQVNVDLGKVGEIKRPLGQSYQDDRDRALHVVAVVRESSLSPVQVGTSLVT